MKTIIVLITFASLGLAASVSSITCTGGVATVTAANTFVANQGFELTGSTVSSYNINSSVASANSTSFTFNVACNGSATGGTVVPAQQILVTAIGFQNNIYTVNVVFWLTSSTPVPCPSICVSAFPKANAAQIAALQSGTTVEVVPTSSPFSFASTTTGAQMNTAVTTAYASAQANFGGGLAAYALWCNNGSSWSAICN